MHVRWTLALLSLLVLFGCGGGGGSSSIPAPGLISPRTPSVPYGGTVALNAARPGAVWSVKPGGIGGTVSNTGVYTPPTGKIGTDTVVATLPDGSTDEIVVTVTTAIHVNLGAPTVSVGKKVQFSATTAPDTTLPVLWSVAPGGAGGIIDGTGQYTAPLTPGTDTVVVSAGGQTFSVTVTVQGVGGTIGIQ